MTQSALRVDAHATRQAAVRSAVDFWKQAAVPAGSTQPAEVKLDDHTVQASERKRTSVNMPGKICLLAAG